MSAVYRPDRPAAASAQLAAFWERAARDPALRARLEAVEAPSRAAAILNVQRVAARFGFSFSAAEYRATLPGAPASAERLRPFGGYVAMDAAGWLINGASAARIPPAWRPAVAAIRGAVQARFGAAAGLYLRGSVVHGAAVAGLSDLDAVAVTAAPPSTRERAWARGAEAEIAGAHPICGRVELALIDRAALLNAPGAHRLRFLLAVHAACLAGEDLRPLLGRYRPGPAIAICAPELTGALEAFERGWRGGAPRRVICRCICKLLVRAGFDLVMVREAAFTRDLYACRAAFSRHHPARRERMRQVLALYLRPEDSDDALALIQPLGQEIAAAWSRGGALTRLA